MLSKNPLHAFHESSNLRRQYLCATDAMECVTKERFMYYVPLFIKSNRLILQRLVLNVNH